MSWNTWHAPARCCCFFPSASSFRSRPFCLSRYFLIGGTVQMVLVAVPLTATCVAFGMTWNAAILAGTAGALNSTILVFKALAEWGQTATAHGRRAIGILLFQDVALGALDVACSTAYENRSAAFGHGICGAGWQVVDLRRRRCVTATIDSSLDYPHAGTTAIGGNRLALRLKPSWRACWAAFSLGLPPAIGALAAGIMLSGNRLSKQLDTIVLPFRETFAAVFFVTLGTLLNP